MKFQANQPDLLRVVSAATRAVPKTAIGAVNQLLVRCKDGLLTCTGTDMHGAIIASCPCQSEENGEVGFPRSIAEYISRLPDNKPVTVEAGEGSALVRCSGSVHRFPTGPSTGFPSIPNHTLEGITVEAEELRQGLRCTALAANNSSSSPYSSVLFRIHGGTLWLSSVDGHRASEYAVNALEEWSESVEVGAVPLRSVLSLRDTLPDSGKVVIGVTPNTVTFVTEGLTIVCPVLPPHGGVPDKLWDTTDAVSMVYDRQELQSAMRRIAIISEENEQRWKSVWAVNEGIANISVSSSHGDEITETIHMEQPTETGLLWAMNSKFISQAAAVFSGERVEILFMGPKRALVLRGDNGAFRHVIMPMAL